MRALLTIAGLMFVTACASKPILVPNQKYQRAGHERSEQDINMCMNAADKQLEKTKDRRVMRSVGKGALIGGLAGGLIGSTGSTGLLGGAAIGAGAGAVGGGVVGAMSTPEGAKRGLVNYCLRKKGYEVAGWED